MKMIPIQQRTSCMLILLIGILFGCRHEKKEYISTSISDLETIIEKEIDSFYNVYKRFDYD